MMHIRVEVVRDGEVIMVQNHDIQAPCTSVSVPPGCAMLDGRGALYGYELRPRYRVIERRMRDRRGSE